MLPLHAGDVLYLPAYWNHRVEALGTRTSVSLSVWSSSDGSMLGVDLLALLLESFLKVVHAGYGESRGLDLFQAAMHRVLGRALARPDARRRFFDHLVQRQYLGGRTRSAEFDPATCQPCEAPLSFSAPPHEAAHVARLAGEAAALRVVA